MGGVLGLAPARAISTKLKDDKMGYGKILFMEEAAA